MTEVYYPQSSLIIQSCGNNIPKRLVNNVCTILIDRENIQSLKHIIHLINKTTYKNYKEYRYLLQISCIRIDPEYKKKQENVNVVFPLKEKGKQERIGYKKRRSYHFIIANTLQITSSSTSKSSRNRIVIYVTDSHAIGVGNHASRTMSNNINHFLSALVSEPNMTVKGTNGNLKVIGSSIVRWQIKDDDGKIHTITYLNSTLACFHPNIGYKRQTITHQIQTEHGVEPLLTAVLQNGSSESSEKLFAMTDNPPTFQ